MENNIVEKVRKFVQEECEKPNANYGMTAYNNHFINMHKYAKRLAEELGADAEVVEIAAWLHDIGSIMEGRENHHITGAKIAEKKLIELNYPVEKIELIKKCILNHRGSREDENKRDFIEEKIIAEADCLCAFDDLAKHFWAVYSAEKKSLEEGRESVKRKMQNKWRQLHLQSSKNLIRPKYEAIMLLLD
jgi:uncharacterized protein